MANGSLVTADKHGDVLTVTYTHEASGVTTQPLTYVYDRVGRRSTIDQGSSRKTTFAYNQANQPLTEAYTLNDHLLNGLTVEDHYNNSLSRDTLWLKSSGSAIKTNTFAYDNASRLQTVSDNNYSATYGYATNSPLIADVTFKLDSTAKLTTRKIYDKLNRLGQITSAPAGGNTVPFQFSYEYNDANQRMRTSLSDGSYWLYTYDSLGRVTSGKKYFSDGTPIPGQQYEYGFDDIGNRRSAKWGGDSTGASSALRSSTYMANLLNQYTSRTTPDSFDVIGIADSTSTVSINSSSSGIHRRGQYFQKSFAVSNGSAPVWQNISVTTSGGGGPLAGNVYVAQTSEGPVYDLDGNLAQDGRWDYTWDSENRLIQMVVLSTIATNSWRKLTFDYDYMGRRIRKQTYAWNPTTPGYVLDQETRFVYHGWNLIAELNSSLALQRSYLWGLDLSGSLQGAGGVGGLIGVRQHSDSSFHFAAFDGNGNVAGLANAADGAITATYEYAPFGDLLRATGPMAKSNSFRFPTKFHDDESQLSYYGLRYYLTAIGRWLNPDPIGERGGRNIYAFCQNDAPNGVDVLGKWYVGVGITGGGTVMLPATQIYSVGLSVSYSTYLAGGKSPRTKSWFCGFCDSGTVTVLGGAGFVLSVGVGPTLTLGPGDYYELEGLTTSVGGGVGIPNPTFTSAIEVTVDYTLGTRQVTISCPEVAFGPTAYVAIRISATSTGCSNGIFSYNSGASARRAKLLSCLRSIQSTLLTAMNQVIGVPIPVAGKTIMLGTGEPSIDELPE